VTSALAQHPFMSRDFLPLLVCWLLLLAFGLVMVSSASVALNGNYANKHIVYLVISVLAFFVTFILPLSVWNKLYLIGWLGALAFAVVVLLPGVGHTVNGATRWLQISGFTLQASEVAKFGLMIYLAGYLHRYGEQLSAEPAKIFVPLGMIVVVCGLLIVEPDLGSAVVIVAASIALLFIAGAQLRYFLLLLIAAGAALALLIWIEPYRMQRLLAFIDPWAMPYDGGYQLVQALIAFGRGELFGLGLGEGVQKLYYLPEAHNDFIFAVIAEELGVIGALTLVAVYSLFIVKIFSVARAQVEQDALFSGYCCYFIGLIFAFQLLINLGVNTGALPTKGLTLPFISYGGNSLIISSAMFGFVLRCAYPREVRGG
jgi:cell division protein FtsW